MKTYPSEKKWRWGRDTHSKHGPTDSAVHDKYFQDGHKQHDRKVVIGRDSPGGDRGLTIIKSQPDRGTNLEGI